VIKKSKTEKKKTSVNPSVATGISGIRDNYHRGTAADFLRAKIVPESQLSIVSAYFTIYAFDALKDHLSGIDHLDFLFGEPRFINTLDPERTEKKSFLIDPAGLRLANTLEQKRVARECADWIRAKVAIRSVRQTNLLHGKMYHIRHKGVEDALVGSSNFTVRGLGLGEAGNNIELNLEVDSNRDRRDLKAWFDELWQDQNLVADVTGEVLRYLEQLYQNHAPEFIYYKTLFHLFRSFIDTGKELDSSLQKTSLLETAVWKELFAFQRDGAKAAINKLRQYNGCILADSVGLGKTFEALAVIKYFELKNERALVLCPKKLADNWLLYRQNSTLNPFDKDRFRYDVLHHTDLSRESGDSNGIDLATLNWGNYDLVVIDESHNFRNNAVGSQGVDGKPVHRTRYERLIEEIIRSGIRTKVLLLSATPVNNELADLRNQFSFIAGGDVARDAAADAAFENLLGLPSVKITTRDAQARFTNWTKLPPAKRLKRDLINVLGGDFLKLLDALTIARSRRHVVNHYAEEMGRLGGFPLRMPPVSLHSEIDSRGEFPEYDAVADQLAHYKLWLFRPSDHLRKELPPEIRVAYERRIGGFTQEGRERILTGMMRVSLLKRLESSIDSFRISLKNAIRKIDDLEFRMARFERFQAENPDLDYDALTAEELDDPELAEALQVGCRAEFKMAHLDLAGWRAHLAEDRGQINALLSLANPIQPPRDAKLAKLKDRIAEKVRHPNVDKDGVPNRKILVFTAYSDTARYLYDQLHAWARKELGIHVSKVVGSGENDSTYTRSRDFGEILLDFSPRSKHRADLRPKSNGDGEEVDLLIASDCISEGQNLQDCDTVVNYDIHWNPVRIIQRFGRIDRIGSKAQAVHLVNFWPTANLDRYINLKLRVEARMALVDLTATQTDNPLDEQQLEDLVTADLRLRDRQLERLRKEVLNLEDFEDAVTLADFSLEDFRMDLLRYLETNRDKLEQAPLGLYTVVPPAPVVPLCQPGVIFCLRHKGQPEAGQNEKINPLTPYYLVYVLADGQVRLAFTQAKTILSLFRELALGKNEPYHQLCQLFDEETGHGKSMEPYSRLLTASVESLVATFRRRVAAGLQSGRDFVIPDKSAQAKESADFELITWLVIK
jgi:SNF2 family DNA or RNA helicase